jgi:hypothetical protein
MADVRKLTVCALALCALTAPAALADPPDVAATISGTLERTHEDTAGGPRPISILSTASGPQVVTFAADQPVPPNGTEVELRGRVKGTTLEASSATITGPTVAVPTTVPAADGQTAVADQQGTPLASGTPRTVAIVVITFSTAVAPTYTDTALQGVLVSNANSVSNYFNEQSYGAVSFKGISNPLGDVFHATIASDGSGCGSNMWQTWGSQAAAAVGYSTLDQYDHVIYVFNSHGTCGWAGLAYMPGSEVYIDNAFSLPVVAHELGHNLGVHHAAALRCMSGGQNVAFSSAAYACMPSEYGDPFDIMGSSATNQQNAFHKLQSGWLGSSSGPRVQTITASGDYTVAPLESSSGVALLLVPHVTPGLIAPTSPSTILGDTFALDFRQPTPTWFDAYAPGSAAVSGVQIRLVQTPGGSANQTQLIDTTPLTSTFTDAALAQGATFTDATDSITITTTDVNPLGATVHVTVGSSGGGGSGGGTTPPPDTTPPSSVSNLTATVSSGPVVSLAFGAATDDQAVSSYRVTRDGSQIDNLGGSSTTYGDWTATYGAHTYGVTAVDSAGNVGPTATIAVVVAAPAPPTTAKPPTAKPSTGLGARARVKVTVKIVGRSASGRRALLSWARVAGARGYVVSRNGHRLRSTTARTLVDARPPRGKLLYVVTVAR